LLKASVPLQVALNDSMMLTRAEFSFDQAMSKDEDELDHGYAVAGVSTIDPSREYKLEVYVQGL
jgi:hypothetical protein